MFADGAQRALSFPRPRMRRCAADVDHERNDRGLGCDEPTRCAREERHLAHGLSSYDSRRSIRLSGWSVDSNLRASLRLCFNRSLLSISLVHRYVHGEEYRCTQVKLYKWKLMHGPYH